MLRHRRDINSGALLPPSPGKAEEEDGTTGAQWKWAGEWGLQQSLRNAATTRTRAANQEGLGQKQWADFTLPSPSSLLWLPMANADWKPVNGEHRMEYVWVGLVTQSEAEHGSGVGLGATTPWNTTCVRQWHGCEMAERPTTESWDAWIPDRPDAHLTPTVLRHNTGIRGLDRFSCKMSRLDGPWGLLRLPG